jgi:hypothetical protein
MERDRQGSVRLFPGPAMQTPAGSAQATAVDDDNRGNVRGPDEPVSTRWRQSADEAESVDEAAVPGSASESWHAESPAAESDTDVVDAVAVHETDVPPIVDAEELPPAEAADSAKPARGRRGSRAPRGTRKPQEPRARKSASKPRAPRASR